MQQQKGRISIYDTRGRLLESRIYYSAYGRKIMTETLRQEYLYRASFFHIYPFALDPNVSKLKKKIYIKKAIPDAPVKIERPAAVYTNLPIGFKSGSNGFH